MICPLMSKECSAFECSFWIVEKQICGIASMSKLATHLLECAEEEARKDSDTTDDAGNVKLPF